jgi:hypothetical protein
MPMEKTVTLGVGLVLQMVYQSGVVEEGLVVWWCCSLALPLIWLLVRLSASEGVTEPMVSKPATTQVLQEQKVVVVVVADMLFLTHPTPQTLQQSP